MIDVGFPIIRYESLQTPATWGEAHGERFRDAIHELAEIRRSLMAAKNPGLSGDVVTRLADAQWQITSAYDGHLADELAGIARGAAIPVSDLVILNNYTDFRDIQIPDTGCSSAYVNRGTPLAGQTWDMHGSAKRFVCVLDIPASEPDHRIRLFSVVGCVGMMGVHTAGRMVCVNNINTDRARPGILWPVLIRRILAAGTHTQMESELNHAPLTSGRAFLVASTEQAALWEVMPDLAERIAKMVGAETGHLFHTNHCLGEQAKRRETTIAQTSTTHIRYDLLQKKISHVRSFDDLYDLLNDHENYPQSICSNYQATQHDPSITCGGAVAELTLGRARFWRGDPIHDAHFVCHDFSQDDR